MFSRSSNFARQKFAFQHRFLLFARPNQSINFQLLSQTNRNLFCRTLPAFSIFSASSKAADGKDTENTKFRNWMESKPSFLRVILAFLLPKEWHMREIKQAFPERAYGTVAPRIEITRLPEEKQADTLLKKAVIC